MTINLFAEHCPKRAGENGGVRRVELAVNGTVSTNGFIVPVQMEQEFQVSKETKVKVRTVVILNVLSCF